MSRETVVCTTSWPASRSALASSLLRRDRALARRAAGSRPAVHGGPASCPSTSGEDLRAPSRRRRRSIVSGGVSRSTRSPAESTTSPRSRHAATTGAAGRSSSAPTRRPRPRTSCTAGSEASPPASPRPALPHVGEQVVVERVADGARRGAGDRVAAERRGVVAGREAAGRLVGDEQAADRQAVGEALRQRDELAAERRAARRRRTCPSARRRSGSRRRTAAPRLAPRPRPRFAGTVSVAGGRRPRPGWARRGCRRRCRRPMAAASDSTSFSRAKRTSGTSGSNAGALGRLAGDRQGAEGAAVEGALERDETGLAGRLARVLQSRLDRLGAGVAEERLGAAEAVGQLAGELGHRLASSRGSRRATGARSEPARRPRRRDGSGRGRRTAIPARKSR